MKFSQYAGHSLVPVLARLVLFAAFLPAGFHKVFHTVTFEGQQAEVLTELGVGQPLVVSDAGSVQFRLASWQDPQVPATGDPAVATPDEKQAPETSDLEQTLPAGGPETPEFIEETRRIQAGEAPPPVEAVEARALHGITVMLIHAGFKPEWRPQYMAWGAGLVELLGGALIFVGLFSRLWGLALAVTMCFAFYLTTLPGLLDPGPIRSLFAWASGVDGYAPFNRMVAQLGLLVLSAGIFLTGPGAFSADRIFFSGSSPDDGLDDVDDEID